MDVLMEGTDIHKRYRTGEVEVEVLKGIDFQIFQGEFIVILGQSGSGKTTLLNIIGGMTQATAGELYYQGPSLHSIDEQHLTLYRRNQVGFVFQNYNLMPTNTMEAYHRQLRKVTKTKMAFPTDDSLRKIIYLATKDITKKQHFSLYHSQTIDFTGIFTDFKSVSNSEFFKAFVRPYLSFC